MLQNTLEFIIRNVGAFFVLLLLVRFYMQAARLPLNKGIGLFVMALTNFMVLPARRILRPFGGYDTASIVLAWIIAMVMHWAVLAITPWPFNFLAPSSMLGIALLGLLTVFRLSLYLLFAIVIGLAVLSWINPRSPLMPVLARLAEPLLRPLQRIIPPIAGVDITPLILIFLVQLVLSIMVSRLEAAALQLMVLNIL
jgi:YggT family protein